MIDDRSDDPASGEDRPLTTASDTSSVSVNRRKFLAGAASLIAVQTASRLFEVAQPLIFPQPILCASRGLRLGPWRTRSARNDRANKWTGVACTPLQDQHGIITPSSLHFERHHNGVPALDPGDHRLLVHGLVARPSVFTVEALQRFPSVSRLAFIECAGNTRTEWREAQDVSVQDTHRL